MFRRSALSRIPFLEGLFGRALKTAISVLLLFARTPGQVGIPTPKAFFGFEPGTEGRLIDYGRSLAYFRRLAAGSRRVMLREIGRSSEGRPMVVALIGDPDRLAGLDRHLHDLARIADPRGLDAAEESRLLEETPALVLCSMSIHATEVGAAQFAPVLAHLLATSDEPPIRSIRRNVLVALLPATNPDGMDLVAAWNLRRKAENKPKAPLPYLYQRWAGHDNNRDWFMLNLQETRVLTRQIYEVLHPLVLLDMHQMGNRGPRFFVPPYADPVNPNLDPILTRALNLLGSRMAHDLSMAGCTGVVSGTTFDNWWNGGNRNVPFRHNILGILTECASADWADTIVQKRESLRGMGIGLPRYEVRQAFPDPWPGGRWSLADILRYDRVAALSLLGWVARNRRETLERRILLGRRAVRAGRTGSPRAFLLPADPRRASARRRLAANLQALGVEIRITTRETRLQAGGAVEEHGKRKGGGEGPGILLPEGTLLIPAAQPYRSLVKDLLERQVYPELLDAPGGRPIRPYDAAGWSLPLQFRVPCFPWNGPLEISSAPLPRIPIPETEPSVLLGRGRLLPPERGPFRAGFGDDALALGKVCAILAEGGEAWLGDGGVLFARRAAAASEDPRPLPPESPGLPKRAARLDLPRIGIYDVKGASNASAMDEGWTRYVLSKHCIPFERVDAARLRGGGLADLDVLVFANVPRAALLSGLPETRRLRGTPGGIGEEGLETLRSFVRKGGRILAWGASVGTFLPLEGKDASNLLRGTPRKKFYCPGSLLEVRRTGGGDALPLAGMPGRFPVYVRDPVALRGKDLDILLRFGERPLLSGHLVGGERIEGKGALARLRDGKGSYLFFAFRPQNRGQTLGTFPILIQALLGTAD